MTDFLVLQVDLVAAVVAVAIDDSLASCFCKSAAREGEREREKFWRVSR